ncbi:membrane protein [Salmonella enterica subsp. enterica serovar Choleraesuis]|nr:membrane protein [Salmonella enterica subsp. enterica serovar Choleraesuis]
MNALLYALVVVIWGTTWIAIVLQQGVVPATVSIFWRFALSAIILLGLLTVTRRLQRLTPRDHLFCLAQGACVFGFNYYCFYHATSFISSGLESVIFSMAILFNALNGWLWFRTVPAPRFYLAAVLGIIGICTLFWRDLHAAHSAELLTGVGLSLLGTWGFSLGNMISTRHQRRGLDTFSTNGWAMSYGALIMGLVSLAHGDSFRMDFSLRYLGSLGYLTLFGSIIAFGAYFTLVKRIGAGPAAYSTLLFPLVALGISTVYEGYEWTPNALAGLALILGGNLVMFIRLPQRVWRRRPQNAA